MIYPNISVEYQYIKLRFVPIAIGTGILQKNKRPSADGLLFF